MVNAFRVGGSFRAFTVKLKEEIAEAIPSLTVMVTVPFPNRFVAGVRVIERFVPDPPNTMLEIGIKFVLEEAAVRINESGGVSTSFIVNAIGPAGRSSKVDCGENGEIVGVPLTEKSTLTALERPPELAVTCLSVPATSNSKFV